MESMSAPLLDLIGSEGTIRIRLDLVVMPVLEFLSRRRMEVRNGVAGMSEDRKEGGGKRAFRECARVAMDVRRREEYETAEGDEDERVGVAQEAEGDAEDASCGRSDRGDDRLLLLPPRSHRWRSR